MKQLTETFRPSKLSEIRGQPHVTKVLSNLLKHPRSCAIICSGDPGTGKTSCAYALAAELGADAFGSEAQRLSTGFWIVASNGQGVEALDEIFQHCRYRPLCGSMWWVVLLEESECKSRQAVAYLKTRLEMLPSKTIVIFTTNSSLKEFADPAIAERCICLKFESNAETLWQQGQELVSHVWQTSLGHNHAPTLEELGFSKSNSRLSFRAIIRALEPLIEEQLPDEPEAPPVVAEPSVPIPAEIAPAILSVAHAMPLVEAEPEPSIELIEGQPGEVEPEPFTLRPWEPEIGEKVLTSKGQGIVAERVKNGRWRVGFDYFTLNQLSPLEALCTA